MTEQPTRGQEVTWLFVPGDRPERFDKAILSGADAVIIDLEDAVVADHKVEARLHASAWLRGGGSAWVRINGIGQPWHDGDLSELATCSGLNGVILPKAEDPVRITTLAKTLPPKCGMVALIESARGVLNAPVIAACSPVQQLAFGAIDFALDIGAEENDTSMLFARSSLVLASRAAGLPAPLDGVTTSLSETQAAAGDARSARSLGFGGKLCIHPNQIRPVAEAFEPAASELAWARSVLTVSRDGAATSVDGRMIDKPLVERARRMLKAVNPV